MRGKKRFVLPVIGFVVLLLAITGCFPTITPDKTPPTIESILLTLSSASVQLGNSVDVTVVVNAKDSRSYLKNAQITLQAKGATGDFFDLQSAVTVDFQTKVKTGSVSNKFTVLTGGNSLITQSGNYTFRAKVTVSDSKDNKSDISQKEGGPLAVSGGTGTHNPVIGAIQFPNTSYYSEGNIIVVPDKFNIKVTATDADNDLTELEIIVKDTAQATLVHKKATGAGVAALSVEENDIQPDLQGQLSVPVFVYVKAVDALGHTATKEQEMKSSKQDIAVIETIGHVRNPSNPAMISHYRVPTAGGQDPNIQQQPVADRLPMPFGVCKLNVTFADTQVAGGDKAKVYIYTSPTDVFDDNPDAWRGDGLLNAEKKLNIAVTNFWRQNEADESKWLVIVVESGSGITKARYIWNIQALGDTYDPIFDITDSSYDFREGAPLRFEAAATDELLEAITDLGIRVNIGRNGWRDLESVVNDLNNAAVQQDENFMFAVRYHVKIQTLENETDYASGLVDDGVDYVVSNAVIDHSNINWFDVYHGVIPGMPTTAAQKAQYWWKTDGLGTIVGEDDDDVMWSTNVPANQTADEEPYNGNTNYEELDHRNLPKTAYVYEFTDIDTTRIQEIKKEAFVEKAKFIVWVYPEVVRADRNDIMANVVKPEVIDVVDVSIGPGTWRDQQVDYQVYMQVADWRWGGDAPEAGKVMETANFTIDEDELSPTIEVSGYDAYNHHKSFKKVFRDNDDLWSPVKNYPIGMFFTDTIEVFSGAEINIKAYDDIALNDFLVYFEDMSSTNRVPVAPFIGRTDAFSSPLTGYDYVYGSGMRVLQLKNTEADQLAGNAELVTIPAEFIGKTLRLMGSDFKINGTDITPKFILDQNYEYYVNFTNDDVIGDTEIAAHNASFGREDDLNKAPSVDSKYEKYAGEFSSVFSKPNNNEASFSLRAPDVEGDYYVWLVARDRSAQDTKLFDYPFDGRHDFVNEKYLGEYETYAIKNRQSEIFGNLTNNDGNPNFDKEYYDDSMSSDDADMVVLLKIRVKPHSWDIMRLDINEPDLVSYPTVLENVPVWYTHSYHPWQVPEEFNDSDLKVDERELPRDMYPVYKYLPDFKEGDRRIYNSGKKDPTGKDSGNYNPYNVQEEGNHEFVPIVGGNNSTNFRVRTHEDLTRVSLYLVEGEFWYNEGIEAGFGNLDTDPTVIASVTMEADNNKRKWGFWEWNLDWNVLGLDNVEATYTIAVRAYHSTTFDSRVFYEQFQWPVFVDTKGPELKLYNSDREYMEGSNNSDPWSYSPTSSYLAMQDEIERNRDEMHPYPVGEMVSLLVNDGGAIYFEENKGWNHMSSPTYPYPPAAGTWKNRMQVIRAEDLAENHQLRFKAGDTTTYERYWKQDLTDFSGSWRLGFPGTQTEIVGPGPTALGNSLKYLMPGTTDIEYLNRNTVLGLRDMNYMSNIYSPNLDKTYDVLNGALPQIALFHNIDFEDYFWRNMGTPQQEFNLSVLDELGNQGTWNSYLRKTQDFVATTDAAFTGNCRMERFTMEASSLRENLTEVEVKELPYGFIKDVLPPAPFAVSPISQYWLRNNISGVLQPAYQPVRLINMALTTESGYNTAQSFTVPATYAGTRPVISNTFGPNVVDLYTVFDDDGQVDRTVLRQLLRPDERFAVNNYDGSLVNVISNFVVNDDNVDMYRFAVVATPDPTGTNTMSSASKWVEGKPSTDVTIPYGVHVVAGSEFGYFNFVATAVDCADTALNPAGFDARHTTKVWFQNKNTFVKDVYNVGSAPGGLATGAYIEFQSDVFFMNEEELLDNIGFKVGAMQLTMTQVYQWNAANSTWERVNGIGRNNKFRFVSENPFFPPAAPAPSGKWFTVSNFDMTARGTGGFTISFGDVFSIAGGKIFNSTDNEEINNSNPSKPENPVPATGSIGIQTDQILGWDACTDPDHDTLLYDVYLATTVRDATHPFTAADIVAYNSAVNSYAPFPGLAENVDYWWKVVVKDGKSGNVSSDIWTFSTSGTAKPVLTSPENGTTGTATAITLSADVNSVGVGNAVLTILPDPTVITASMRATNNKAVPDGASAVTWDVTLDPLTAYTWYVTLTDASGTSMSDTWGFLTRSSKSQKDSVIQLLMDEFDSKAWATGEFTAATNDASITIQTNLYTGNMRAGVIWNCIDTVFSNPLNVQKVFPITVSDMGGLDGTYKSYYSIKNPGLRLASDGTIMNNGFAITLTQFEALPEDPDSLLWTLINAGYKDAKIDDYTGQNVMHWTCQGTNYDITINIANS